MGGAVNRDTETTRARFPTPRSVSWMSVDSAGAVPVEVVVNMNAIYMRIVPTLRSILLLCKSERRRRSCILVPTLGGIEMPR